MEVSASNITLYPSLSKHADMIQDICVHTILGSTGYCQSTSRRSLSSPWYLWETKGFFGKEKGRQRNFNSNFFFIIALKKPEHAMQIELLKQTVTDHEIISCWIYFYSDFPKKTPASFIFKFFKIFKLFFFILSVVNRSQVRNTRKRRSDACLTFWPMSTWHGVMAEKRSFRVQNQHRYCV